MVKCVSYQFGSSDSGTEWMMLKSALGYDRKSGDASFQKVFLFTITSDSERKISSEMKEDIDAGKSVNVSAEYELRKRA